MKLSRLIILFLFLLTPSIHTSAQQPLPVPGENTGKLDPQSAQLLLDLFTTETEIKQALGRNKSESTTKLADIYKRAAADPNLTRALLAYSLKQYFDLRSGAESAMQVSQAADEANVRFMILQSAQNQTIIQQNKRIIELLEQIANRK
jgi:hypothetical protein